MIFDGYPLEQIVRSHKECRRRSHGHRPRTRATPKAEHAVGLEHFLRGVGNGGAGRHDGLHSRPHQVQRVGRHGRDGP